MNLPTISDTNDAARVALEGAKAVMKMAINNPTILSDPHFHVFLKSMAAFLNFIVSSSPNFPEEKARLIADISTLVVLICKPDAQNPQEKKS